MKYCLKLIVGLSLLALAPLGLARGAIAPQDDFLIVTGADETLASLHSYFSGGGISLGEYLRLLYQLNPTLALEKISFEEPLAKNFIVNLPGVHRLRSHAGYKALGDSDQMCGAEGQKPESLQTDIAREPGCNHPAQQFETGYDSLPSRPKERLAFFDAASSDTGLTPIYDIEYSDTLKPESRAYVIEQDDAVSWLDNGEGDSIVTSARMDTSASDGGRERLRGKLGSAIQQKDFQTLAGADISGVTEEKLLDAPKPLSVSKSEITKKLVQREDLSLVLEKKKQNFKSYDEEREGIPESPEVYKDHNQHDHVSVLDPARIMMCVIESNHREIAAQLDDHFQGSISEHLSLSDTDYLTDFLTSAGYLDASVDYRGSKRITYIDSGRLYHLTAIIIEPRNSFRRITANAPSTTIQVKETYSQNLESSAKALALQWLAENGFPFIDEIKTEYIHHETEASLRLAFTYEPERPVQIKHYEQYGDLLLQESQLKVISPFTETSEFSLSSLEVLRKRLLETGYYTNVGFELIRPENLEDDGWILGISSEEKAYSRFNSDFGYSRAQGVMMTSQLAIPNLTGIQDDLSLDVSWDNLSVDIGAKYLARNVYRYGIDGSFQVRVGSDKNRYYKRDESILEFLIGSSHADGHRFRPWEVSLASIDASEESRLPGGERKNFKHWRVGLGRSGSFNLGGVDQTWTTSLAFNKSFNSPEADFWHLKTNLLGQLTQFSGLSLEFQAGLEALYASDISSIPAGSQLYIGTPNYNRGYPSFAYSSLDQSQKSFGYLMFTQLDMPIPVDWNKTLVTKVVPFLDLSVLGGDADPDTQGFASFGIGFVGKVFSLPFRVDVALPATQQYSGDVQINFQLGAF